MFANLIESQSHGKEFKRRGRFVIATAFAYTVLFFVAGIVSIYAYDAQVEAQTDELEVLSWVPPVTATTPKPPRDVQAIRRQNRPVAPVDPNITVSQRTSAVAQTNDPTRVPEGIGTKASPVPPVTGPFQLSTRNVDPPIAPVGSGTCVTCNTSRVVPVDNTPPPIPTPVKLQIQKLPSSLLMSKVISLPQPPYPPMAKQIGVHGAVPVQILIDESGRVIAAQAVSGSPMLTTAAKEAAMRARFTPTILSGTPVKVQGTIIYNFVLQ
jgi:protein TonB